MSMWKQLIHPAIQKIKAAATSKRFRFMSSFPMLIKACHVGRIGEKVIQHITGSMPLEIQANTWAQKTSRQNASHAACWGSDVTALTNSRLA